MDLGILCGLGSGNHRIDYRIKNRVKLPADSQKLETAPALDNIEGHSL
jgi:hypothetical protein